MIITSGKATKFVQEKNEEQKRKEGEE